MKSASVVTTKTCILYACDTFKGTLSSQKVGESVERGLTAALSSQAPGWGSVEHLHCPMSDGGAGLLDSITFRGGAPDSIQRVIIPPEVTVHGPLGALVSGVSFGCNLQRNVIVVEMAAAAGLPLIAAPSDRNPLATSTYGVGEVVAYALQYIKKAQAANGVVPGEGDRGVQLHIGIGGSATNEGGLGALQALGLRIFVSPDGSGDSESLLSTPFCGRDLGAVTRVEMSEEFRKRFIQKDAEVGNVHLICDVDNPLTGPHGATYVFGPQKCSPALASAGRSTEDAAVGKVTSAEMESVLAELEKGMCNAAARIVESTWRDLAGGRQDSSEASALESLLHGAGGGGAGGMSGFLHYLLNARWAPGAEAVASILNLRTVVDAGAGRLGGLLYDRPPVLVVTGEGSFDEQTIAYHKTVGRLLEMIVEANLLSGRGKGTADVLIVCGRSGFASEEEGVDKTRAELVKVFQGTTKEHLKKLFEGKTIKEAAELVEAAIPNLHVLPLTPDFADFHRATTEPEKVLMEAIPAFIASGRLDSLSSSLFHIR